MLINVLTLYQLTDPVLACKLAGLPAVAAGFRPAVERNHEHRFGCGPAVLRPSAAVPRYVCQR